MKLSTLSTIFMSSLFALSHIAVGGDIIELLPENRDTEQRFGTNIDARGNRLLIGADTNVYLYELKADDEPVKQFVLRPAESRPGWTRTLAVSLEDEYCVAADHMLEARLGGVLVFPIEGGKPGSPVRLEPPPDEHVMHFGRLIATSEDMIAIRADSFIEEVRRHVIFLYKREQDNSWEHVGDIRLPQEIPSIDSMTFEGDYLMVFTINPRARQQGNGQRSIYFYKWDDAEHEMEMARVLTPNGRYRAFGVYSMIDAANDRLVITGYGADTDALALVFEKNRNEGIVPAELVAHRPDYDAFGSSVKIGDGVIAVGSMGRSVTLYFESEDGWERGPRIRAGGGAGYLQDSVALTDDALIIGRSRDWGGTGSVLIIRAPTRDTSGIVRFGTLSTGESVDDMDAQTVRDRFDEIQQGARESDRSNTRALHRMGSDRFLLRYRLNDLESRGHLWTTP